MKLAFLLYDSMIQWIGILLLNLRSIIRIIQGVKLPHPDGVDMPPAFQTKEHVDL